MPTIRYEGQEYTCHEGETLLDAFLRQGVHVPFSCRSGVCRVCLHRCSEGSIPEAAQRSLDPSQRDAGYLLLCRCRPTTDLTIDALEERSGAAQDAGSEGAAVAGPEPELWQALDQGRRLRSILEAFYARVYQDPQLKGFFAGVTPQRAVDKQYLFLRQLFTGEKVYFGDRPRNAHHWMVISDELFDYRQSLLRDCMRAAGLAAEQVAAWLAREETFRSDIVKAAPWNKVVDGVELSADGFGEEVLEVGSMCDGCGEAIDPGTRVRYHLRLGKTWCPACGQVAG